MASAASLYDRLLALQLPISVGIRGPWRIEQTVVDEDAARRDRFYAGMKGHGRCTPAGTYWRLVRQDHGGAHTTLETCVMSDTPDERRDCQRVLYAAESRSAASPVTCLVLGLGLGFVTRALLELARVAHVTVIERAPDVLAMVGPKLTGDYPARVTLIEADALEWRPAKGQRWTILWNDIFDSISSDNWPAMVKIRRRFCRRVDWIGEWCRHEVLYARTRDRHANDRAAFVRSLKLNGAQAIVCDTRKQA